VRTSTALTAASILLALLGTVQASTVQTSSARDGAAAGWPSYNMGYASERYSDLAQITPDNVGGLEPICETQVGEMGPFQSGLLVIGRRMYLTTPRSTLALDAVSCAVIWRHVHAQPGYNINPSNRGPAYADGRVFRGTAEGAVLALDAATGAELWKVQAGRPERGEVFSAAPIVWRGRVYIGTTGGDWGGQARVMAFDVRDGRELWRFNVIPQDGEVGADTWNLAPGAARGGGSTWSSYTLDPSSGELFVATGNPAPALAPNRRLGANLFTDALVVLDAAGGKLKWYVQPLPGDALDYDMAAAPMLYRDAHGRALVALAGKDGYLYLIDRASHRSIAQVPVTTILNRGAVPTVAGLRACPGVFGGVEWNGPALDARTKTVFVGAVDMCMMYRWHGADLGNPAASFGTTALPSTQDPIHGWVTAVDGTTGKTLWRYPAAAPIIAGLTATAGGVLLTGDSYGTFLALDAATGRELTKIDSGGTLAGGVITYEVDGRQYIAYTAGGVVRGNFVKDVIEPKVVIAALAPPGTLARRSVVRRVIEPELEPNPPPAAGGDPAQGDPARGDAAYVHGAALYANLCTLCHGPQGEGFTGPRLKGVSQRADPRPVAAIIRDPGAGMARFYPGVLSDRDVADLALFIEEWNRAAP
jgi:alcohol dehydrogenase (cytochrome c)